MKLEGPAADGPEVASWISLGTSPGPLIEQVAYAAGGLDCATPSDQVNETLANT
jgi:hypothetical protein